MKLSIRVWMINGLVLGLATTSPAQIIPDNTLPTNSRVTSLDGSGLPIDRIDDGTIRGSNLFHSFREFNVGEGRGAYFTNPSGIENILSRVTGNDPSNILGTLGVLGNANLVLMNPNGIIFGQNASLNIGGSFIGTTANVIQLGNAGQFSASEPAKSNLLSVNPSALFFNAVAAQSITNRSQAQSREEANSLGGPVGLQVPTGRTLGLVGGDVVLEGGNLTAAGGRIELGSVAGPSLVSLTSTDKGQSLGYDGIQNFRDIQLSQQATVDATGAGDGDIHVQGRQVTLTDGSRIEASTLGAELGGTLNVIASESVELSGTSASGIPSSIFARVQSEARGAGSNLTIDTPKLNLRDGAQVATGTFGKGSSGNLEVRASEIEAIGYPSGLFTTVQPEATGAGGNLTVETGQLILRDGAQVAANTFGKGSAGNLEVNASELVELIGRSADGQAASGLFTSVARAEAIGGGGNLTVDTERLILRDGAQVAANTFGEGAAGNLVVNAAKSVEAIGQPSGLFTTVNPGATGDGGNLTVKTDQLILRDGAQVAAGTFGKGASGALTVKARSLIEAVGISTSGLFASGLYTSVVQPGTGKGGNLTVETERLILRDGAQVAAGTFGEGSSGDLEVKASKLEAIGTSVNGQPASGLFTTVGSPIQRGATGDGGNLTVKTDQLILRDGAQVFAGTFDEGQSGTLTVTASDLVELIGTRADGQSASALLTTVQPGAKGAGGDLTVETERLILRDEAQVAAGSLGIGDAGDLTVDTKQLIVRDGARVAVSSEGTGNAGNLKVLSPSIRLDNQATLSADTTAGKGNIILDSQDIVLRRGSNITTDAKSTATGGNITINTDVLAALEDSDITANAQEAFGGRVIINAQGIFRSLDSDITASSDLGPEFSGIVEINTPDVELQGSLTQLSANFISPEQVVAGSCLARRNVEQGSFVVTGTGGLPRSPYEAISGRYTVTGVQPIQGDGSVSQGTEVVGSTVWKKGDPIQEAQGMVVTADGRTIVGTAPQLAALAKAQNLVCRSN